MRKLIYSLFFLLGIVHSDNYLISEDDLKYRFYDFNVTMDTIYYEKIIYDDEVVNWTCNLSNLMLMLMFRNYYLEKESNYNRYMGAYIHGYSHIRLFLKNNTKSMFEMKNRFKHYQFSPFIIPQPQDDKLIGILIVKSFY